MACLYFLTLLLWCVLLPLQFLFKLPPVPFYTQRRCLSQGKSRSSACAWFWACCLRPPLFHNLLHRECRGRTCPVGGDRQIMNVFCWHLSLYNQFKRHSEFSSSSTKLKSINQWVLWTQIDKTLKIFSSQVEQSKIIQIIQIIMI